MATRINLHKLTDHGHWLRAEAVRLNALNVSRYGMRCLELDEYADQIEAVVKLFEGCDPDVLPDLSEWCDGMEEAWAANALEYDDARAAINALAPYAMVGRVLANVATPLRLLKDMLAKWHPGTPEDTGAMHETEEHAEGDDR